MMVGRDAKHQGAAMDVSCGRRLAGDAGTAAACVGARGRGLRARMVSLQEVVEEGDPGHGSRWSSRARAARGVPVSERKREGESGKGEGRAGNRGGTRRSCWCSGSGVLVVEATGDERTAALLPIHLGGAWCSGLLLMLWIERRGSGVWVVGSGEIPMGI